MAYGHIRISYTDIDFCCALPLMGRPLKKRLRTGYGKTVMLKLWKCLKHWKRDRSESEALAAPRTAARCYVSYRFDEGHCSPLKFLSWSFLLRSNEVGLTEKEGHLEGAGICQENLLFTQGIQGR
ncbi:hypothetical protein TNIN_116541 [Trichonephila inaurata madagascariensis]|uniref:Uncharacterized protein n=1 Tax=Trichonephila inaurata madagascariensis TaxID=2747483 RepID=A0A8X6ML24_9ARAC|nr:hypothetical protein TNIN_116541 [Trichonephila inaurata madagascariensis]